MMRVGLAQINTTVGDLKGNVAKVLEYARQARNEKCDVVAFPELTITGYPPEDLLRRGGFVKANQEALQEVVAGAPSDLTLVVGFADGSQPIYNAAAVIAGGRIQGVYRKQLLPNYGVFDEQRYFGSGTDVPTFDVSGVSVGVSVCEDIWEADGPVRAQAQAGARVMLNINGSPYHMGKQSSRQEMLAERAKENGVTVCYVNLVGGQDELVFDGGSMALDARGELLARAVQFEEELLVLDVGEDATRGRIAEPLEVDEEVYSALVLGTRDYVRKVGFEDVLIGLSGGIDSSLVVAVAVDALGAEHVHAASMPSRFSSEGSIADARALAENFGVELRMIPIEPAHAAFLDMLAPSFAGTKPGVAEENVQARVRGNVLMSLSNKLGWLVLTTGNKSEYATGYCTLYGDMAGGYAVIKDVPKTLVYRLAEHRNRIAGRAIIPRAVIEKAPSAELREDQLDADSLPPYEELDPILAAYVEEELSLEEIVSQGHDEALVRRVAQLVDRSEYKRRQSPPGVKITPLAFGRDRRLPIANRYRG
ncbi:MAG: NAD+ synthase [Chloroflexi bacterium]|nr:NAD+ synthase [Chloroflexota bacterium]MCI0855069.1 NAD+ synthase [Chloroflexota bacterium]MCI0889713.1 NAD+ synthase [Chloroflexota bacterium]